MKFVKYLPQFSPKFFYFPVFGLKTKIKICRIIIYLVVFCGCETESVLLMEEFRLRVFERRTLGPKRGVEVHNDDFDL